MGNSEKRSFFFLKPLDRFLKRRLLASSGEQYANLFNTRAWLAGRAVRVAWLGDRYQVADPDLPGRAYVFRHEKQGNMAYGSGLKARAESLGDAYFLPRIDFRKGDVVLDCGANVGDLKLWFDLHGLDIEYIGFEPSPVEFGCLQENVAPSVVHNVGLWSDDGELTFFVSSQGADSSLIEPQSYDEKITVQTKRLQTLIGSKVKLLKLEAEGAEPEILEGLGDKLADIEFISADLGYERGKAAESTLAPVTNYLLSNNFELVDMSHRRICALFRNRWFAPTSA